MDGHQHLSRVSGVAQWPRRPNRSARERREQHMRAEARAVQRLLRAFGAMGHRGCQLSQMGNALQTALLRQQPPVPDAPDEVIDVSSDVAVFSMEEAVVNASVLGDSVVSDVHYDMVVVGGTGHGISEDASIDRSCGYLFSCAEPTRRRAMSEPALSADVRAELSQRRGGPHASTDVDEFMDVGHHVVDTACTHSVADVVEDTVAHDAPLQLPMPSMMNRSLVGVFSQPDVRYVGLNLSGGAPESLPPGWERAVDTVTGRPYFYNRSSGESRWDPPRWFGDGA